jgi:hypothetical protein
VPRSNIPAPAGSPSDRLSSVSDHSCRLVARSSYSPASSREDLGSTAFSSCRRALCSRE